jgi:predicted metal-dependent hydrolase
MAQLDLAKYHFKRRWANCTAGNALEFHPRVMALPSSVLDYVIVHELCHTIEKNHTKAFGIGWRCICRIGSANMRCCKKPVFRPIYKLAQWAAIHHALRDELVARKSPYFNSYAALANECKGSRSA